MTMENPRHEEEGRAAEQVQPPAQATVPNPSRRRFTRAGVGASALVMTVTSRSVLANAACTTASGFYSANQSARGTQKPVCNGFTPDVWMTTPTNNWPVDKDATFASTFGGVDPMIRVGAPVPVAGVTDRGNATSETTLSTATFQQALYGELTPLVVKYIIAALFNAVGGKNAFPTRESVIKIFQEWNLNRQYEVSAGVFWTAEDIIKYLRATQTPGMS